MAETMQVSAQRAWTHLKKYQPLIHELVSRDLKVKYRRSFLGYIWSILNPLLMMLLQSIIFSYMFRNDIPNFPLYLICGNTLFTFFNETTSMGLTSVIQNAPLIKKVYIPKFIFPISQAVSRFVTMLFSFGAVLLVMIFTRATFYWTIFLSWLPLVLLFFFSCLNNLLLDILRCLLVSCKLVGELAHTTGHCTKIGGVTIHLCHWHICCYHLLAACYMIHTKYSAAALI